MPRVTMRAGPDSVVRLRSSSSSWSVPKKLSAPKWASGSKEWNSGPVRRPGERRRFELIGARRVGRINSLNVLGTVEDRDE
jgi:hypothetical protein